MVRFPDGGYDRSVVRISSGLYRYILNTRRFEVRTGEMALQRDDIKQHGPKTPVPAKLEDSKSTHSPPTGNGSHNHKTGRTPQSDLLP